jgi:general secretion pathway protein E
VLVNQGIADERTIAQCLADAFGFPVMLDIRLEQLPLEPLRALGFDLAWARKSRVVPVDVTADVVTVAVADPLDTAAIDDLRPLLGRGIEAVVSTPTAIAQALNHLSTRIGGASGLVGEGEREAEARPELELEDEAQVIRWVSSLFLEAIDDRATDIHIQPEETEVVVRHRVDGELQRVRTAPLGFLPSIAARIKVIAGLDLAEKRLPQDGRIGFKVAGKNIDVRVSTIPVGQGAGERIVLRILDQSNISLSLTDLGFTSDRLARMRELVQRPHGIVLVTGPTGSGKTTTLYACLNQINRPNVNILTTEDPIEYRLRGVSQMQVNPKIGLDFASCLRAFLRQDPDVIMVGEIRDRETASVAVQASLTGHLVLSTVHTNDAAGATARLGEMGVESFHIASTLQGVLAQRLVRVLCHACKRPAGAQYEPVGCAACKGAHPEERRRGRDPPGRRGGRHDHAPRRRPAQGARGRDLDGRGARRDGGRARRLAVPLDLR